MTNASDVIEQLKKAANPKNAAGMARFGINANNALGVSLPNLRQLAKQLGKSHVLAEELWKSGIHEARILASIVDDAKQVTSKQMDAWVREFDSWDVCDQVCMNLFDKTAIAYKKAGEWSARYDEFEKLNLKIYSNNSVKCGHLVRERPWHWARDGIEHKIGEKRN